MSSCGYNPSSKTRHSTIRGHTNCSRYFRQVQSFKFTTETITNEKLQTVTIKDFKLFAIYQIFLNGAEENVGNLNIRYYQNLVSEDLTK